MPLSRISEKTYEGGGGGSSSASSSNIISSSISGGFEEVKGGDAWARLRYIRVTKERLEEVLRSQIELFGEVLRKGKNFNSVRDLDKRVIRPANSIAN